MFMFSAKTYMLEYDCTEMYEVKLKAKNLTKLIMFSF